MSTVPFSTRLKEAIASGSSAIVAAMISEAEKTARNAKTEAAAAKLRALDPMLDEAETEAAQKAATDAEFLTRRMAEAVALLTTKRDEFRRAEDRRSRLGSYEAARHFRDSAAARFRDEYPRLANQLGELFAEMVAADEAVELANRDLPNGYTALSRVEAHARPGHRPHGTLPIAGIVLPAFDAAAIEPTWGPSRLALASPVPAYRPNPITNAEEVLRASTSSASAADEPALGNRPGSSVRLVPRTSGEAA